MTELFDIPETLPKWAELRDRHRVYVHSCNLEGPDANEYGSELFTANYAITGFKAAANGSTEKEAVITLIHRLQLDGWKEVSL